MGHLPADLVELVDGFLAGCSSAATRAAYRSDRTISCGKHITPHSLRHSAITAALNAGVSLRDVPEFARHADPTQDGPPRPRPPLPGPPRVPHSVTQYVAGAAERSARAAHQPARNRAI